jgi:ABC-type sugar transport system permease subunit
MNKVLKRIEKSLEEKHIAVFLAPALFVLMVFAFYITIALIYLSFCDWNVKNPSPVSPV